jgi:hypothetical protein
VCDTAAVMRLGVEILLLALTTAPAQADGATGKAEANVVVVPVDAATARAARALGPDVLFFTARRRPLRTVGEIRAPGEEMATANVGLVRPLLPLLRAGGVDLRGGALDLMRLVSAPHLSAVFQEHPRLKLLAIRRRADGSEQVIASRGGGVPVVFRGPGEPETPPAVRKDPPAPAARGETFVTSFGPLVDFSQTATARARTFDPFDGARVATRQARPGRTFLVLRIDRDFGLGQGVVGFLFGSGTLLKPEFETIEVRDGAGRRYPLSATFDEGRTLELAYEVPQNARGLVLVDGDLRLPLEKPPARAALAH